MGSFDSTCAVSRTSIREGEPVLACWTNIEWANTTYELVGVHRNYLKRPKEREELLGLLTSTAGILEVDNWLEEEITKAKTRWEEIDKNYIKWMFGTYNDYGFIEEETLPNEARHFLVHAKVAERLVSLWSEDWYFHPENIEFDFLLKFLDVCHAARIHVFDHQLLGSQFRDRKEMFLLWRVNRIISRWIHRMTIKDEIDNIVNWFDFQWWKVKNKYKGK